MTRKKIIVAVILSSFLFGAVKADAFWPTFDVVGAPSQVINTVESVPPAVATPADAAVNTGSLTTNIAQHVKEFVLDPLAVAVARSIIRQLTAQTVNWINSGFKGNPAFVTNPDQFFLSIGDNTASRFIASNGVLSQLCSPFQAKVRLALVKAYLGPEQPFACSLSTIKNNYEAFTRDFSQGGWDGWFEMTQSDMGNPYGAFINAQDSLNAQIGNATLKKQTQLNWGRGFMSWDKCVRKVNTDTGPDVASARAGKANSSGNASQGTTREYCEKYGSLTLGGDAPACEKWVTQVQDADGNWHTAPTQTTNGSANVGDCPTGFSADETGQCVDLNGIPPSTDDDDDGTGSGDCAQTETVTPGSLIETQLEKITGTGLAQLELTNSINQVVSALFTQLVTRIVGGIGNGLRGASQPNQGTSAGGRSLLQQMSNNSPEVESEAVGLQKNIESSTLPQLRTENGSATTTPDVFFVPPTDQQIKNKAQTEINSVPEPSGANTNSVTCVTSSPGIMTCQ